MNNNRRNFIKKCGLSAFPFLLATDALQASPSLKIKTGEQDKNANPVNFIYDGLVFSPERYIEKLIEINTQQKIERDFYGAGGATALLENEFAKLTGKEKAIYLPTGTMANQLAIKLLNENNTKVIVPENSHVFRDEADAAQSVYGKRLIPIGKGKPYFDLNDLKEAIIYTIDSEVFKSGLGTIVIENPIRRADGKVVPIEVIREISDYCRQNGYRLHLDGARIHLACAFTKLSLTEYASYFDTVYISLYKYLNAAGGAILCGSEKIIGQIPHQIKIYGGTVYQTWGNTTMALHYLENITERWEKVTQTAQSLITELNKIKGVTITNVEKGTNIYNLKFDTAINVKELAIFFQTKYNILLGRINKEGIIKFTINESILNRDISDIVHAWKEGIEKMST
ncbi:MAG TPA: aminotransferase class I/II-fold pyridoxal phosphate-dependent enzyme [Chitinophagaceae bacterium]|nr:aminotransferase class I/II-fold pyridoxal phosphate-dependent enzyme [Chitinophagaceae bacterium]